MGVTLTSLHFYARTPRCSVFLRKRKALSLYHFVLLPTLRSKLRHSSAEIAAVTQRSPCWRASTKLLRNYHLYVVFSLQQSFCFAIQFVNSPTVSLTPEEAHLRSVFLSFDRVMIELSAQHLSWYYCVIDHITQIDVGSSERVDAERGGESRREQQPTFSSSW